MLFFRSETKTTWEIMFAFAIKEKCGTLYKAMAINDNGISVFYLSDDFFLLIAVVRCRTFFFPYKPFLKHLSPYPHNIYFFYSLAECENLTLFPDYVFFWPCLVASSTLVDLPSQEKIDSVGNSYGLLFNSTHTNSITAERRKSERK